MILGIVYFEAVRPRMVAAKEAMDRDTIFRIYSVSKPVTAVAALIFVDEGKLGLDDPVSKYLPELEHLKVLEMGDQVGGSLVSPQREHHLKVSRCGTGPPLSRRSGPGRAIRRARGTGSERKSRDEACGDSGRAAP